MRGSVNVSVRGRTVWLRRARRASTNSKGPCVMQTRKERWLAQIAGFRQLGAPRCSEYMAGSRRRFPHLKQTCCAMLLLLVDCYILLRAARVREVVGIHRPQRACLVHMRASRSRPPRDAASGWLAGEGSFLCRSESCDSALQPVYKLRGGCVRYVQPAEGEGPEASTQGSGRGV